MADTPVISVDGVAPLGLNLSHWPGHRTPGIFRADLATESCLRLAGHPDWEYWTAPFDTVTNTHIDTDGVLSVFAILQPRMALEHADTLVSAAASGDLERFWSPSGVQLDLTIQAFLAEANRSPLLDRGAMAVESHARTQWLYEALLAELPRMLQDLGAYRDYWEAEYRALVEAIAWAKSDRVALRRIPLLDLATVTCTQELPMAALRCLTQANRLLLCAPTADGIGYRLVYGIETWFDLVQFVHAPRTPFEPLQRRLGEYERGAGRRWRADPIDALTPCLGCVDDAGSPCGSGLPQDWVESEVVQFFRDAASHSAARN